jgi:hypothetical protein
MRFIQSETPIGTRFPLTALNSGTEIALHLGGALKLIQEHLATPQDSYAGLVMPIYRTPELSRRVTKTEDQILRRAVLRSSKIVHAGTFVGKK